MTVADVVAAKNEDRVFDAAMHGIGGVILGAFVFGFVYGVAWITLLFVLSIRQSPTLYAAGVTLVFVAAAAWSAVRDEDPLADLAPLSSAEAARRQVEKMLAASMGGRGLVALGDRRTIAGFASVLIGGPRGLVKAWRALAARYPTDPELLSSAQDLLERCARKDLAADDAEERDPRGFYLLWNLNLVRLERGADGWLLRPTFKGKELLGA